MNLADPFFGTGCCDTRRRARSITPDFARADCEIKGRRSLAVLARARVLWQWVSRASLERRSERAYATGVLYLYSEVDDAGDTAFCVD